MDLSWDHFNSILQTKAMLAFKKNPTHRHSNQLKVSPVSQKVQLIPYKTRYASSRSPPELSPQTN